jgi:aspartate/methionine/tyrosine aminotransferase
MPANRDTLVALQAMAEDANVHVLVDEVYLDATNLLHDPPSAQRPRAVPRASGRYTPAALIGDRLLSISSLTKSYGLSGLRCGWVIASPAIAERARRVRDVIDNIGAAPADRLSALAFSHIDHLAARAHKLASTNIDIARAFFVRRPGLELAGPIEATVAFPRLKGVSDTGPFVTRLFAEHGVAVVPGSFFGAPAHIRLSLGGATEILTAGLERIDRMLEE